MRNDVIEYLVAHGCPRFEDEDEMDDEAEMDDEDVLNEVNDLAIDGGEQ
jgi:hypothetical protein